MRFSTKKRAIMHIYAFNKHIFKSKGCTEHFLKISIYSFDNLIINCKGFFVLNELYTSNLPRLLPNYLFIRVILRTTLP